MFTKLIKIRSGRLLVSSLLLALLIGAASSCHRGPAAVKQPRIDAGRAGRAAIELYDLDGNGMVAGAELDKAPALKSALPRLDSNSDGGVSADEIAARVRAWQASGVGLMSFGFTVTLNGSPLPDAVVTFVPAEFLGSEIQAASCTTNRFGAGSASIPPEDRPDPSYPPGMQLGLYQVKISKIVAGKETIPAKYNESTILGQEVAQDVPEIANRNVLYALSTK